MLAQCAPYRMVGTSPAMTTGPPFASAARMEPPKSGISIILEIGITLDGGD
jgi:hypothetical protein